MSDRHTFLFVELVGFTALTAQEGDERAADVALELCERIRPLLADHGAEEIKAIGDALMLRGERLCSAAAGGEVLVSDATRQAVGSARSFEFGERRLHWLKNVTEPVEVWVPSPPEPPEAPRSWRRRFESFPRLLQGACP